ncbi:MAG TPA: ABC transporter permease subunit [Candidatus Limnocylindria bacterium]|nr:ABC transporter permease subunit [Candidatus Limnocylindria bacterium]
MRRGDIGRMLRNVALVAGLAGVVALGAVALFGPQLSAADPQAQRLVLFYPDGTFKVPPTPPDPYYPLGTDPLGRDQLARILWGARLTFTVVLLALLLRALLAVVFGVLAGWRGGTADALVTLVTNAVAGIPQLLLALLVAVALRENAILGFVVALGCVGWAEGAQFVRAEVMRIRRAPYVEAATALGARTRGIITRHLLRSLAPQLFGLIALEAGATLLLLAELGFLGVFMSGGVVLVDNSNRPILPVRDRTPEWGQMLAGAQSYAFSNQFVAFVPGVVVAAAVFAFNLLGEGARAATDPFSSLSLSPRAVGSLGRGLLALTLLGGLFFGVVEARSTELSFDDALRLAREAVERVEPGDELLAAVVRYSSDSHALARPQKLNFYFRSHGIFEIVRVGFPDADQNAMEVQHDDEDGLNADVLATLDGWSVPFTRALEIGEDQGGRAFRNSSRGWLVRVVLTHQTAFAVPTYRVTYSAPSAATSPNVNVLVDARSGAFDTRELRFAEATLRAEGALGGPVALTQASGRWSARSPQGFAGGGFDAEKPVGVFYTFVRADLPEDRRTAFVGFGAFGQAGVSATVGSSRVRPTPIGFAVDLEAIFAAVEAQGGREQRDAWSRDIGPQWSATADAGIDGLVSAVRVRYGGPERQSATFRYDLATGRVERTQ